MQVCECDACGVLERMSVEKGVKQEAKRGWGEVVEYVRGWKKTGRLLERRKASQRQPSVGAVKLSDMTVRTVVRS